MLTREEAINRAREKHGNKYDYSKVTFNKVTDDVTIICPIHGEFQQAMRQHYRGQGCPKCFQDKLREIKKDNRETFIEKSRKVHGDKYDYSKVEYIKSDVDVTIICPTHGEFHIKPYLHIQGEGCPKCGRIKQRNSIRDTKEKFIEKARKKHGDKYNYSKVEYIDSYTPVTIICPVHGEFHISPNSHLQGRGCKECGIASRAKKQTSTIEKFIQKAGRVHRNKYDYSKVEYKGKDMPVTIICPTHGEFQQKPSNHLSGCGCQFCGSLFSHYEEEIVEYLSTLISKDEIQTSNRSILSEGRELDIVIPSKKLAIEFDGLYWHNEIQKPDKNYHLKKTEECEAKGYQLVHIFEDEWIYKKDICKSRIAHMLQNNTISIMARKCIIKPLSYPEYNDFFNKNHIQGNVKASNAYGLFYNNELVSAMSFGQLRKNLGSTKKENTYELLRFANKINYSVVGGASRLFKHFIREINPNEIISYADRRWSKGNLYEKLGFTEDHKSQPSYFYVFGDTRKNRFGFRKDILISKYGCKAEQTEHEFCLSQKWYRIYDCGCICYIWKKETNN